MASSAADSKESTFSSSATPPVVTSASSHTLTDHAEASHDKAKPEPPTAVTTQPLRPRLGQRKKWALLAVFSLAYFIDSWNAMAMFIFTGPISRDLSVVIEQHSWVITSYSASFASSLMFWGRMSDIFSAKAVFVFGFVGLGLSNLILSFMIDKYSFFIFRAISGIAAASVIPAAYRLIVMVFEPEELGKALALYGMSGAMASIVGILGAGVIELIPGSGQMRGWRWFFRIMSAVILPIAFGSFYWIPSPPSSEEANIPDKWKRLDLVGSLSMLVAIILLILGLTLGATVGWRTPQFLVPFLLSFLVFPFFFIWEARIPFDYALLPPSTWRIPNFTMFIIFALYIYSWMALIHLPFIETFVSVYHDSPVVAAARMTPFGIAAAAVSVWLTIYPRFVARPLWPIVIGMLASVTGCVLYSVSNGGRGDEYWKFVFTGNLIGAAGIMTVLIATNVGVMTSVPPEMAGVAGAILQVALQVGQVVALSIQAGLLTVEPGNYGNWVNVRVSFIFVAGWGVVWLAGFLVFFKPAGSTTGQKEGGVNA